MWYSSDECSYDKYSTSNQNIRNISYKMMKEMADEINSYVKEKELENTQKYEDNSKNKIKIFPVFTSKN